MPGAVLKGLDAEAVREVAPHHAVQPRHKLHHIHFHVFVRVEEVHQKLRLVQVHLRNRALSRQQVCETTRFRALRGKARMSLSRSKGS